MTENLSLNLPIKIRDQIVADGLSINDYDVTNVGDHLSPNNGMMQLIKENLSRYEKSL